MTRRASLAWGIPILVLLSACSPPAPEGPATVAWPVNGASQNLQKSTGVPICNLDQIGEVTFPFSKSQPITIRAAGELKIWGFAVDDQAKALAGGVDVVIDGKPFKADYQQPRGDVADHFKVPAYSQAGFSFAIASSALSKGPHQVLIRVISSDGKTYQESPAVAVDLR